MTWINVTCTVNKYEKYISKFHANTKLSGYGTMYKV